MTIQQIAESISKHQFNMSFAHFANDITWNLVGGEEIKGKEAVIKACEESATYLSTVTTTFTKFRTFVGDNVVVIESAAEYIDDKKEKSIVSSCDIYEFSENKLINITSYNIELPQ